MKTKRQSYIYIGPSVPQIGLKQNTLYKDENPPEALAKLAQEKPVLRALYVSTKELAKTQIARTERASSMRRSRRCARSRRRSRDKKFQLNNNEQRKIIWQSPLTSMA